MCVLCTVHTLPLQSCFSALFFLSVSLVNNEWVVKAESCLLSIDHTQPWSNHMLFIHDLMLFFFAKTKTCSCLSCLYFHVQTNDCLQHDFNKTVNILLCITYFVWVEIVSRNCCVPVWLITFCSYILLQERDNYYKLVILCVHMGSVFDVSVDWCKVGQEPSNHEVGPVFKRLCLKTWQICSLLGQLPVSLQPRQCSHGFILHVLSQILQLLLCYHWLYDRTAT